NTGIGIGMKACAKVAFDENRKIPGLCSSGSAKRIEAKWVRDVTLGFVKGIAFDGQTVRQMKFQRGSKRVTLCFEDVIRQTGCLVVYNKGIGDRYARLNSKADRLRRNRHPPNRAQQRGAKHDSAHVFKKSHCRDSDGSEDRFDS